MCAALEAASRALERDQQGRAWLAWHTGFLAQVALKSFPDLSKLTGKAAKAEKPPQQSPEEIRATLNEWRVALAGRSGPPPAPPAPPRLPKPPH